MPQLKLWLLCAVTVNSIVWSATSPCRAIPRTEPRDIDYDKDEMIMEDIITDANADSQGTTNSAQENWIDTQETTTLSDGGFLVEIEYLPDRKATSIKNTQTDTQEIWTDTSEAVTDAQITSTSEQNIPKDTREILISTQKTPADKQEIVAGTDFDVTSTPAETPADKKRRERLEADKQFRIEGIKLWVQNSLKINVDDINEAIFPEWVKIKRKNRIASMGSNPQSWKMMNTNISGPDHAVKPLEP